MHGVLVVGDDGELIGWVTARGVLHHHAADWQHLKAGRAISEPCVRVAPSTSVPAAIDAMLKAEATRLVVMRPGSRTPDGVVSDIDLVQHLSRWSRERLNRAASAAPLWLSASGRPPRPRDRGSGRRRRHGVISSL